MSEDKGMSIELTAKQAALASLLIGLVVGASGAVAVTGSFYESQTPNNQEADQPADTQQQQQEDGPELVSMEGIDLENEPSMGEESAPIKVIEYNDYGCPFCAEWNGFDASGQIPIDQLDIKGSMKENYIDTGEVELIVKDYPVPNLHPNGPSAHKAANCVYKNEEDSYFDYKDELFDRRDQWMASGEGNMQETFRQISNDLGLDTETVMQCYAEGDNQEADEDKQNAVNNLGRFGTPTFYVGNQEKGFIQIEGAQPLSRFEEAFQTVRNS